MCERSFRIRYVFLFQSPILLSSTNGTTCCVPESATRYVCIVPYVSIADCRRTLGWINVCCSDRSTEDRISAGVTEAYILYIYINVERGRETKFCDDRWNTFIQTHTHTNTLCWCYWMKNIGWRHTSWIQMDTVCRGIAGGVGGGFTSMACRANWNWNRRAAYLGSTSR